ncbi:RDD family protein [Arthrobacter alpinus]|nr:RDD family protein [Arthrobacter alpinus]
MSNRAASPTPSSVPLGGPSANPFAAGGNPYAPGSGAPSSSGGAPGYGAGGFGAPGSQTQIAQRLPGIVNVSTAAGGPLLPPVQVGVDPRAAEATALANGGAGRRLAAKIIDGVPPAILLSAGAGIGSALVSTTAVEGGTVYNFMWLSILLGVASLLSLAYVVWQWMWEAKSGKTLGNVILGLRTTNMEGHPAGLLAIFLRSLMVSLSSVVPTAGPIVMLISNIWDKNGKKQGWHDKVAHTLVFNVAKGRNPLETGGIGERENFSPAPVATISQVQSPLARPAARPAAPVSPYTSASVPASGQGAATGPGQGAAPGPAQQFAGQFPGAPTAVAAPAPGTRAGRRNKKRGPLWIPSHLP